MRDKTSSRVLKTRTNTNSWKLQGGQFWLDIETTIFNRSVMTRSDWDLSNSLIVDTSDSFWGAVTYPQDPSAGQWKNKGQTNSHASKSNTLPPPPPLTPAIMLPPSHSRCPEMVWLSQEVGSQSLDVSEHRLDDHLFRLFPGNACDRQDVGMDNL